MHILEYFGQLFTLQNLMWLCIGATVGVVLGALPGMSADTRIGIFLPLTFSLPPTTALICLGAIYVTGSYGGNITAVLVNTPGTSDSLFMTLDGYPMTLKGEGLKAIGVTTITAFVGGIVGCLALLFIAPMLAKIAFFFGSWELFLTVMMGIIIIIGLVKERALKGLMSAALGFLCSLVGLDGLTGVTRFSFGISAIYDELPLLPVVLGMFAFSQVFVLIAENRKSIVIEEESMKGKVWLSLKELKTSRWKRFAVPLSELLSESSPQQAQPLPQVSAITLQETPMKTPIPSAKATPRVLLAFPLLTTALSAARSFLCLPSVSPETEPPHCFWRLS